MKRFRQWICSITGHWFTNTDVLIFTIKTNARNNDMTATLTCKCCGEKFVHKDAP